MWIIQGTGEHYSMNGPCFGAHSDSSDSTHVSRQMVPKFKPSQHTDEAQSH